MALRTELNDTKWPAKRESKFTFYGVLCSYYDEIFSRCADETRSGYNGQYNSCILPEIGGRIIEELELEDYEAVVDKVKASGVKPATVQRYRYLIRTVVKCAVEKGYCQDVLFGSIYSISPNEGEALARKKEFVRNKKSLEVEEEKRLFKRLMTDEKQMGPLMGLVLMFCLGLRNNEACALQFRDIKEMNMYPGAFCVWVHTTTVGATNKLKAGGKTRNAPRVLPIPPVLYEFLMERKAFLQEEVDSGRICFSEEKGICSVDDLPIACKKTDYTEYCSSPNLTTCGRLVLREVQVKEEKLTYIDARLQDDEQREKMGVVEKDPTAYLLRRNLATHLHILGLTEAEIQYFMGHDMEDRYADRNEYTNEERLYAILQKLQNRPLFNKVYPHEEPLVLGEQVSHLQRNGVHAAQLHFGESNAEIVIEATAEEPNDPIRILVEGDEIKDAEVLIHPAQLTEVKRIVNINNEYQQAYKKSNEKEKEHLSS